MQGILQLLIIKPVTTYFHNYNIAYKLLKHLGGTNMLTRYTVTAHIFKLVQ